MRYLALLIAAILCCAPLLPAQTQANTGQIEGLVTDPAGASVAGAAVRIRNADTNQLRELKTDAAGFYRATLLQIGPYEISVQAQGFSTYRQTGINLSTGQILTINARLALPTAQQEITVSADAAVVEAAQVSTSRAVNAMDIDNLPNLSRSELNFAFLQPFVDGNRPREYEAPRLNFGGLAQRVNFQVDGFQNSTAQQKAFRVIIFSTAALQETQIASLGATAESGRTAGGVVNNIIRSGTNKFRGQASYLTSRKAFNARPFGALPGIHPVGNVWIGAVGGPIKRDKLFFFASYEASRRAFPRSLGFTTPAAKANAAALGFTGAEVDVLPSRFNPQLWLTKFDWRPRQTHAFSLRLNTFREFFAARDPGSLVVLSSSNGAIFNEAALAGSWTWTISANTVNEFRSQVSDRFTRRYPVVPPGPNTLPDTAVSGVAEFGYPTGLTANREKIAEWSDNLTRQVSKHQVKTGFNVVFSPMTYEDQLQASFSFGGLTASGSRPAVTALDQYLRTRQGLIDPATNRPYTYTQLVINFGERVLRYAPLYYGAYLQDQWRATRNLTLNYGVRWESGNPPEVDKTAPYALSRQFPVDRNNVAPRFGFAWTPRGSTKTAIRGGWGLYYDGPQGNYFRDALTTNGQRQLSIQIAGTSAGAPVYPNYPASLAGLATVKSSLAVIDPTLVWMYVQQATLAVQREVVRDLALTLTYAFTKGTKIPGAQNINLAPATGKLLDGRALYTSGARIDPTYNNISMLTSGGNSNYNGLGINLNKRFRTHYQFNLAYTWSHGLDNCPEAGIAAGSEYPQDSFNRRAEYGNSLADVRHVLNGSAVLRPRLNNKILNNNQLALFFFARRGTTFNVLSGTDLNRDSVNNDRPYYFGRNTGKGPASTQPDLRYSRFFPLREGLRAQFTAEAANVFNTPVPDSTTTFINRTYGTGSTPVATFGNIISRHEMRRLQLGFRLDF